MAIWFVHRPMELGCGTRMVTLAIRLAVDRFVRAFIVVDEDMALWEDADSFRLRTLSTGRLAEVL